MDTTARTPSPLVLLLRPSLVWALCTVILLGAFHLDYWATVGFFQRRGIWVSTDFVGTPMPLTNALDLAAQLGLPFGALGVPVAMFDLHRGRRLFSVLEATCSAIMLVLGLTWLRVI